METGSDPEQPTSAGASSSSFLVSRIPALDASRMSRWQHPGESIVGVFVVYIQKTSVPLAAEARALAVPMLSQATVLYRSAYRKKIKFDSAPLDCYDQMVCPGVWFAVSEPTDGRRVRLHWDALGCKNGLSSGNVVSSRLKVPRHPVTRQAMRIQSCETELD